MSNLQHFAKTPATRIDSMEVYESPFQSRMSGKLFQSGLRFDDYFNGVDLSRKVQSGNTQSLELDEI